MDWETVSYFLVHCGRIHLPDMKILYQSFDCNLQLTRCRLIGRTTEVGSRTLVEAAKAGEETHGIYMTDCQVGEVSRWVQSEDGVKAQQRVYAELITILEGIETGISKNV